jgi:citrate lyase subunit beta/citryl-CoA lyase
MPVVLTALYVPGDRPERFATALASGADVVIVDLEDAVAPDHKPAARANLLGWLPDAPAGRVDVRVNAAGTGWGRDDLAALPDVPALRAVRLPKVATDADVAAAARLLPVDRPLHCLIESALGVENAYRIATAPGVGAIGLGEADLSSELATAGEPALAWVRSRIVVAASAAGLDPPMMSVHPDVADLAGLAESCRRGRELGLLGRAAIHPRQLPVIRDAFRPDAAAVRDAHALLAALEQGTEAGHGVVVLADGRMVDPAMAGRARRTIELVAGTLPAVG